MATVVKLQLVCKGWQQEAGGKDPITWTGSALQPPLHATCLMCTEQRGITAMSVQTWSFFRPAEASHLKFKFLVALRLRDFYVTWSHIWQISRLLQLQEDIIYRRVSDADRPLLGEIPKN
jgi:hypothetical protein